MKLSIVALLASGAAGFAPGARAQADTNVVVAFTTANPTALNTGFAGFTTELLGKGEEYGDTNLQHSAAMLSPGWLLFPAGTTGDAFNWATGMTDPDWCVQVGLMEGPDNSASNLVAGTILPLTGKGGAWFTNFAAMAQNLGGAQIIVCVNGFTDTSTSAGAFAAFALSNHIHVAAWELCNEPYLFSGATYFFTNGADYAGKMKPYRDAIKAADPNAVVAVFFSDPGRTGMSWNNSLTSFTDQYWDAVVYHHYPQFPTNASFAELMAMDNGILYSNTSMYITNVLMARNTNANTTFLLTEFAPGNATSNGSESPPTSTLYGGVYAAEYVMRLSACPRVMFAGSYQLVDGAGVDTTNDFRGAVDKAANGGYTTNTAGLPFGFFLSAQGSGEAVAYWAINRSTAVYATSVGTNGPVVPMDTNGIGTMPALCAQAYQGGNGKRYVVLTNKGSNAIPVQITQDGAAVTNQLLETLVTGSDPTAVNSNPPTNNVVIETNTASSPLTIPEFSVVRLEWTVFDVPRPVLSLSASRASQQLQWTGLSNVVYNVQGATNLPGTWTTLGRVPSATTHFAFTHWYSGPQQFFQLAVP